MKYLAPLAMLKIKIVNILCDYLHEIDCRTRKLKRGNRHVHLSVCLRPETKILTTKQDSKYCNTTLDIRYDGTKS